MDVPFTDDISGLANIKLLNHITSCDSTIKVKCFRNTGFVNATNSSSEPVIFNKDEALGIVDLRPIGYDMVKQSTIQHNFN